MSLPIREPFNALSHLIGAVLSFVGWGVLSLLSASPYHLLAVTIYGVTLVGVYVCSALYHGLQASRRLMRWLKRMDRVAITVFIAGTVTPFSLLVLPPPMGWGLFGLIWTLAGGGVLFSLLYPHAPRVLFAGFYLLMGWISLFFGTDLWHLLSPAGFGWLVAGGVLYTVGAGIYVMDWPRLLPGQFEAHELWHTLTLMASGAHYVCIAGYAL